MRIIKPLFWDNKKLSIFSLLLLPFTILITFNNFLRGLKNNKRKFRDIKTICVGNIYVGGTGKTPLAVEINKILQKLKYRTTFIKKFYAESVDEQILLKKNGNCILALGSRMDALKDAINQKFDLAIFDDGLQDGSINYDLKFVCFNSDKFIGNGFLIPSGPLRERINSLKKYDAVFLNGHNKNLKTNILKIKKHNKNIKIFKTDYKFINQSSFNKKDKYIAFAGIGVPENFKKTLKINNFNVKKFLTYPDHYNYSKTEIKEIKNIARSFNAKIITTEKDYLRIKNNPSLKKENRIKFIKMKLKINNEKKLINFLNYGI